MEECKCWDGYEAIKSLSGSYYCRGRNINKLFRCNEDKPPICKCSINGKEINLELGETNCFFQICENEEEWEMFRQKSTEFRELGK